MRTHAITITTADGIALAALLHEGEGSGPQALLLHMMPATKESWNAFAEALLSRGFSRALAIDLRGHGGSTIGPDGSMLDHRTFDDAGHQQKSLDVEAAAEWLRATGGGRPLVVAGASIGANLAIVYGSAHEDVMATVALSPGLDYRGVTTADKMAGFEGGRPLLLAASDEDIRSLDAVRELARMKPDADVRELSGAGHGTAMLDHDPAFLAEVADWLVRHSR